MKKFILVLLLLIAVVFPVFLRVHDLVHAELNEAEIYILYLGYSLVMLILMLIFHEMIKEEEGKHKAELQVKDEGIVVQNSYLLKKNLEIRKFKNLLEMYPDVTKEFCDSLRTKIYHNNISAKEKESDVEKIIEILQLGVKQTTLIAHFEDYLEVGEEKEISDSVNSNDTRNIIEARIREEFGIDNEQVRKEFEDIIDKAEELPDQ